MSKISTEKSEVRSETSKVIVKTGHAGERKKFEYHQAIHKMCEGIISVTYADVIDKK